LSHPFCALVYRQYPVCRLGLKLTKAYRYLSDVQEHKQVIPFTRFNGGVGRASQAKQFGRTQGTCCCCYFRPRSCAIYLCATCCFFHQVGGPKSPANTSPAC
jgi:hypothetical protein